MGFNVLDMPDVKSYLTHDNAVTAVRNAAEARGWGSTCPDRVFNVMVVQNSRGRFVPIICNINPKYFHAVIHIGFMVVN